MTYSPVAGTILNAGTYTLSVTAAETDNYNEATKSVTIKVIYGFNGLLSPYAADKAYKIKSAIPLKWQYTNSSGVAVHTPTANPLVEIFGPYTSVQTDLETILLDDAGKSGYQYDSLTYTWQYNWKTTGLKEGLYYIRTTCMQTGQVTGLYQVRLVK